VAVNQIHQTELIDLKKELQNREAEIELLQETFAEIGSELDLEKVFQIVADRARELIHADTLLIPILDDSCSTYTYRGGSGKNSNEIVGESLPLDFGVCGWVWRHKKAWWRGMLNELSEEERNLWEKEAGSLILIPLQGRKHFLGGIAGIDKTGGGEFDRRDLTLLSLFSSIVSIAIENAMAVNKIEQAQKTTENYQLRLERLNKQLTESSRELEYLSLYDTVTSLPNRSLFRDRLTQHLSVAYSRKEKVSLLLIDLNNFKDINETLGHDKGDALLKNIANRFLENIEPNESLSRLGGDEFILTIPKTDEQKTLLRAQVLLDSLEKEFDIEGTEIAVSASIGAAVYPEHGKDISTLLRHADHAMYDAKANKLGINFYNPAHDHSSLGQLTMVADLRKALDEDQFELHYQPKLTIKNNKLIGVEALGRWPHPIRGFIPPNIFIGSLEQTGLIDKYTRWVIKTALQQITTWKEKDLSIKISVNISTQTLMNPNFMDDVEELVKEYGANSTGQKLVFEITENLFLSEYDRLSETLIRIRRMGISFSIDDFGTGYSSLSRLKKLPVSELKIDQSFVMDMINDLDDEAIVKSTIDLGHNLGLIVVAEGVEDDKTYKRLGQLGCDTAQGYLISKALPIDQFDEFISNSL
jgi:diguanylate cyclase